MMKNKTKMKKIIFISGAVIILSAAMVFAYMNSGNVVDAKEGDFVNKGEIILSKNDTTAKLDINVLRAHASGVAAQAANANSIANNSRTLFEAGAISQAEYNATKATASQLNSQLTSLNYSIQSFKQGSGVGGLASPVSGYITELYSKEGETVLPGLNIVEISPLEIFYITLNLIPEDVVKVKIGNPVTIKQDEIILSDACKVERISKKAKETISEIGIGQKRVCLLYTSDAADEEDSVDLGGRRI